MSAAGPYPLPTEPNPEIRRLDARDLPAAVVADGLARVAALLPVDGPAILAVLRTVEVARPDVLAEVRRREAARLIERHRGEGYTWTKAREKAARAVGVSPSTVRQTWEL